VQASRKHGLSITIMVERALQAYLAELERGAKNA